MSTQAFECLKELFFAYEDDIQEKGVLVGVAPEGMVGVQLTPELYDSDGEEKIKVQITVETTGDPDEADEDLLEEVSDAVQDWLRSRGLEERMNELGINPDLLDWFPVSFQQA
jgi:hypothetical protein